MNAGRVRIKEFLKFRGLVRRRVPLLNTATGGQVEVRNVKRLARFFVRDVDPASYEGMRRAGLSVGLPKDLAPSQQTLLALESARWRGNLPAASVGQALVPSGVLKPEEAVYGAGNPMSGGGTAVAGEVDSSGRNAGKPSKREGVEAGRAYRRQQVHALFERLRRAVKNQDQRKAILASPAGKDLVALARAFEGWLNEGRPKLMKGEPGAAEVLVEKLYIFLRTYQG